MARRTGPPECCGTCSWSLLGLRVGVEATGPAEFNGLEGGRVSFGVLAALPAPVWGVLFPIGREGKVEYGPSCTVRLCGGRPRILPVDAEVALGHAADTDGPCLLRGRGVDWDRGCADCGASGGVKSECEGW